ncbi:hypothetical protein KDK77_08135, partial [bacterium]|nr:hypothetical protein [bacterium]
MNGNNKIKFFSIAPEGKKFKRILSLLLIESLAFSSVAWADEEKGITSDTLKIPNTLGAVQERYAGETDSLVIHIQDTHTSYSAQKYLSHILRFLHDSYDTSLIGIEGASGIIDTSEFSRFPDKEIKKKVSEYFLKSGKIDGTEYFSIVENSGDGVDVYKIRGVEVDVLYRSNLDAFLRSIPYQEKLTVFCDTYQENLNQLKAKIYSPLLYQFDNLVQEFHRNELNFVVYCQGLLHIAEENLIEYDKLENLTRLVSVIDLESKINFPRVDAERYIAVRRLSGKLPESESSDLLAREFNFRTKKVTPEEYHFYLNEVFKKNDFSIDEFQNLKNYIEYLSSFSQIDRSKALAETQLLAKSIYDTLIVSNDQRTLYELSYFVYLISKFSNLKMTREEIALYHSYRQKYSCESIREFIQHAMNNYAVTVTDNFNLAEVEENLSHFEEFYKVAHQREQSIVKNTLGLMKQENQDTIVLIAGGFHTPGITEMLQKEAVSYVVVTPNMENDPASIPYLSLLQNFQTPLEQMIATNTSTLKIASWLADQPLVYGDRAEVLKTKLKLLLSTTALHKEWMNTMAQYSREEQAALGYRLETQLAQAVNNVIQIAGYQDVLHVNSVSMGIGGRDFSANVTIQGAGAIDVSFSDQVQGGTVVEDIQDNILEVIQFSDGITTHIMSQIGSSRLAQNFALIRTVILHSVYSTPKTTDEILADIQSALPDTSVTMAELKVYLNDFRSMGVLVEDTEGRFAVTSNLNQRLAAFLAQSLIVRQAGSNDIQTSRIRRENVPAELASLLEGLEISTLIIDPTISLSSLENFLSRLTEGEFNGQIQPGAVIQLSDTLQGIVTRPIDSAEYIFAIMRKPAESEEIGTVSKNIQSSFELSDRSLAAQRSGSDSLVIDLLRNEFGRNLGVSNDEGLVLELSTRLGDGEKSVLRTYILDRISDDQEVRQQLAKRINSLLRVKEELEGRFTGRVARIIIGNSYPAQFDQAVQVITQINPDFAITREIEEQINAALIQLHGSNKRGDYLRYDLWQSIINTALASAPEAVRNSRFNQAVQKTVAEIQEIQQKEDGKPAGLEEFQRIINKHLAALELRAGSIDENKPLLHQTAQRQALLNRAIVEEHVLRFSSRSGEIELDVSVSNRTATNTYYAYDKATGNHYLITLLSLDEQGQEFVYSTANEQQQSDGTPYPGVTEDSSDAFYDASGFLVRRIEPQSVPRSKDVVREMQYRALQNQWERSLQTVPAGVIQASLSRRLTGVLEQNLEQSSLQEAAASYSENVGRHIANAQQQQQRLQREQVEQEEQLERLKREIETAKLELKNRANTVTARLNELEIQHVAYQKIIGRQDEVVGELLLDYISREMLRVMATRLYETGSIQGMNIVLAEWAGISGATDARLASILAQNPEKIHSLDFGRIFSREDVAALLNILPKG